MNYSANNTDKELALGFVNGDKSAFRVLFNKYYNHLVGTAINLLKNEQSAQDIVQDVFFKVWETKDKIDPDQNITGYLKRSVINRCLNYIRDNKNKFSGELPLDKPTQNHSALEELEGQELSAIINEALEKLPERCRLVYTLKRIEGLSLKEIAKKLDISPKTAENQITKALKALKLAVLPYLKDNK